MPKFSVIVPVYNAEAYLDQCVQSVLYQTFTDLELILVDDGSTDSSGTLCECWATKDNRVRVLRKKNRGASGARNAGIDLAGGEYILFLDSDDYWLDNSLMEKMCEQLNGMHPEVMSFNFKKVYRSGEEITYFSEDPFVDQSSGCLMSLEDMMRYGWWIASPWNKAIRSDLFSNGRLRFREGIVSEDIDWCMRLALMAERYAVSNLCVVGYRQRKGSVSGSMTIPKVVQLLRNVQECVRLLNEASPNKAEVLRPYVAYQYGTLVYNVARLPVSEDKSLLIDEIKVSDDMLEWSQNPKIKLMWQVKRVMGFRNMLRVVWIKSKLESILHKRSD